MIEQWKELKETIIELRDNDGTGTQQEVCKFLVNLMDVLEKQMSNQNKGDLISRQAVLDALKEHRALYCDNTPDTFSKLSYAEKSRVDEIDTAIATIVNLPSVSVSENPNKWIPVSNRLPEDRQSVLVWCPERRNIYCACLEKEQWWIFGAFMKVQDEVVAWMPLPEPYKADREASE